MRIVDTAIVGEVGRGQDIDHPDGLALGGLIGGDPNLPVWDSQSRIDPFTTGKVTVTYDVPFAEYASAVGADDNPRLSGRNKRRSVPFWLTYVGATREQAKWAGEKLRGSLERVRPVIGGHRVWLIQLDQSDRIRRDDNVMRPDGSPLYYGIDAYSVSIMLTTGDTP